MTQHEHLLGANDPRNGRLKVSDANRFRPRLFISTLKMGIGEGGGGWETALIGVLPWGIFWGWFEPSTSLITYDPCHLNILYRFRHVDSVGGSFSGYGCYVFDSVSVAHPDSQVTVVLT